MDDRLNRHNLTNTASVTPWALRTRLMTMIRPQPQQDTAAVSKSRTVGIPAASAGPGRPASLLADFALRAADGDGDRVGQRVGEPDA